MSAWDRAHPEQARANRRKWASTHRDEERARCQKYWAENGPRHSDRMRRNQLRREYGLTVEGFNALLARQHGRCAICPTPLKPRGRDGAHVDHDHDTKAVRGLLCRNCNIHLEWSLEFGERASFYVRGLLE